MSEFDSNYTKHDERGVPIVTQQMLEKARSMNCHLVHIVYVTGKEPDASFMSIVPFLPRTGDEMLDMRGNRWICEAIEFRASLVDLADGSKCVFQQPTIVARKPRSISTPPPA